MNRTNSGLLVVDVQEKLMDKIPGREKIVGHITRLVEGAKILGVPVQVTEQYPKGLGPTVPELTGRLPPRLEKLSFSCAVLPEVVSFFQSRNIRNILLAGAEAHVCVMQTALDLVSGGFQIFVAADAVGSRHDLDRELGLRRLERSGVVLTTTETALFEWTEKAGTAEFKQISRLIVEGDKEAS
jgi:nicotinamidase-related amidase